MKRNAIPYRTLSPMELRIMQHIGELGGREGEMMRSIGFRGSIQSFRESLITCGYTVKRELFPYNFWKNSRLPKFTAEELMAIEHWLRDNGVSEREVARRTLALEVARGHPWCDTHIRFRSKLRRSGFVSRAVLVPIEEN